jgi:hypothetical protein
MEGAKHSSPVQSDNEDSSARMDRVVQPPYMPMPQYPYGGLNGNQYEQFATIMGQSGLPMTIPYGILQYAQYQDDPRNQKMKPNMRRGKWTVSFNLSNSRLLSLDLIRYIYIFFIFFLYLFFE